VPERLHTALFEKFARELIARGNTLRFCARGRSMLPTIQDGDTLYVEPIQKSPRVGDIVLFFRDGQFKAHRILRGRGGHFVTRGDSGMDTDGVVRREEIIGKVVEKGCAESGRRTRISGTRVRLRFLGSETRRFVARHLRRWSLLITCLAVLVSLSTRPLVWGQGGWWSTTQIPRVFTPAALDAGRQPHLHLQFQPHHQQRDRQYRASPIGSFGRRRAKNIHLLWRSSHAASGSRHCSVVII